MNKYHKLVKSLRIEKGLSQEEISKKLDLSRSSYIAFEQGRTELSLSQASRIADILGISLEEMKSGLKPDYDKYKQMILAFLRFGAGSDGKIPKTKLAKLVYLADFSWFYKNLKSMSGMSYRKIQYGPVPDGYFRAIDEMFEEGVLDIDSKTRDGAFLISQTGSGKRAGLSRLNPEEEKMIKEISKKWKDKRTQEIVRFTHDQLPYLICEDNEIIPYGLITQENPDHVY
ncbi:MAG: type II toxin-antitoxin system antitoxin SocA domain-containing protein [Patescibacteria group bacterium]